MEIIVSIIAVCMLAIGYTILFDRRNAAAAAGGETKTDIQV